MRIPIAATLLVALGACAQRGTPAPAGSDDGAVAPTPTTTTTTAGRCEPGQSVVHLPTEDGVTLAADLALTGKSAGPAVVLLHMIPPANDRKNYPAKLITALVDRGISVLNVDRRGAGDSGGVALDAYTGPKAALDGKAAIAFLRGHACAFDGERLGMVGASNGTTTTLDYSVSAKAPPRALVFLTGGTYTENQTKLAAQHDKLDKVPLLFVYSTAESAWSKAFAASAPPAWVFKEYANGAHGTGMFAAEPRSVDDVATFLATNL